MDIKSPSEIFQQVQVTINPKYKEYFDEKTWMTALHTIANDADVKLIIENGSFRFEGDWGKTEKAHALLKENLFSAMVDLIEDSPNGTVDQENKGESSRSEPASSKPVKIKEIIIPKRDTKKTIESKLYFSTEHKNIGIMVGKGNIMKENAQAIVCPVALDFSTNPLLKQVCQETGFTDFKQHLKKSCDVFTFKSKKLNGQIFMFVLIPNVCDNRERNVIFLNKVYENIFISCEKSRIQSLALPAVGSDIGYFINDSATAAWGSIEKHAATYSEDLSLRVINFILTEESDALNIKFIFSKALQTFETATQNSPITVQISGAKSKTPSEKTQKKEEKVSMEKCPICASNIYGEKITLNCGHKFCKKCITEHFHHGADCPVCERHCGIKRSGQPPGRMHHYKISIPLPGYAQFDAIVIQYEFPNGSQIQGHPNPGRPYIGTSQTAYLPANPEGYKILDLFKKAFDQKLTFAIGASPLTGESSSVIWNGIEHKTSTVGGKAMNGYPDPDYLTRVKQQLAERGIR